MNTRWIACVFAVAAVPMAACSSGAPPAGSSQPGESSIAAIHASKCGACHTRPDPRTRTRGHLEEAFSRHKRRVRLTEEEWAEMVDYLAMPEGKTAR
jgi:hypothetical protein